MVEDSLSASTTSVSTSSTSTEGGAPSEANGEAQPLREHIPDFLPPFPDKRTYVSTAKFKERVVDSRVIRKIKSKRKRQVEQALTAINETLGETPTINYDASRPPQKVQSLASGMTIAILLLCYFHVADMRYSTVTVDTVTGARNNPYLAPAKIQRTSKLRDLLLAEFFVSRFLQSFIQFHLYVSRLILQPHTSTNRISICAAPKPTPLKPNSRYLKYGDDGSVYRQDETPHTTTTASDDAERNKRMLKCEKILSLSHTSGIDQLDAGFDEETASNAGRDDASE